MVAVQGAWGISLISGRKRLGKLLISQSLRRVVGHGDSGVEEAVGEARTDATPHDPVAAVGTSPIKARCLPGHQCLRTGRMGFGDKQYVLIYITPSWLTSSSIGVKPA